MQMSRVLSLFNRLDAAAMPPEPPPIMTISWAASPSSVGVWPPFAMRRTTPDILYPAALVISKIE